MDSDDDNNQSIDTKLKERFQNVALAYADVSELRALVNFIPLIGSSIDVIISSEAQKIQYNRIRQTITCLTNEIVNVDKDKIDKSFLDTEEFFDLLILFFEKCTRTRHIEKVRLNCKILCGSVIVDNATERPFAHDILNNIADLSPRDLNLSIRIFEQQKGELPQYTDEYRELTFAKERGWDNLHRLSKLTEIDFNLSLFNLANSGLIKEIQGSYIGYYGGCYIITDAFRKFMSFIEFSNAPIFSNYLS